jgi:hypothetical protein
MSKRQRSTDHDYDDCQCGRCIRRRVWRIFLREEAAARAMIAGTFQGER